MRQDEAGPIRLVRVIARLNIGGPSIQAITLTERLERLGYATTLVRGREGEREGSMDELADVLGVRPLLVPSLRRDPGLGDVHALLTLVRIIRSTRPRLVHTHAAKGGTLGRLASLIAFPRRRARPILVHTFHGHSLSRYFSPRTAATYRAIERWLARRTDKLIAVSEEVRDDLVALGVAPRDRFEVIPLGFDLSPFLLDGERRAVQRQAVRAELGIPPAARVVTIVARLVPIKRVDRFLAAAAQLMDLEDARFVVVGDGELHDQLRASPEALQLGERLTWTGFRRDIPAVCFASDVVALTSDQEGTPVSLIEASAAGVPTVTTAVGGAAKVVRDGETGVLVPRDEIAVSSAIRHVLTDDSLRSKMGAAARAHASQAFSLDRLVADIDELYRGLLTAPAR
jgi:glycosyltransferase involved in cell wall biosynthesis